MHNFNVQKFEIQTFDIWYNKWSLIFFGNFAIMDNIGRKYNRIVNFSKFTSKKKILSRSVAISYNSS